MWLLDANMDVHLLILLAQFGIRCEAAARRGWGGLSNGDLVAEAVKAGFTCLLTQDRLFAQSAARFLTQAPTLSLVVVQLLQRPWRDYLQQFRVAWATRPIEPLPGAVVYWPASEN